MPGFKSLLISLCCSQKLSNHQTNYIISFPPSLFSVVILSFPFLLLHPFQVSISARWTVNLHLRVFSTTSTKWKRAVVVFVTHPGQYWLLANSQVLFTSTTKWCIWTRASAKRLETVRTKVCRSLWLADHYLTTSWPLSDYLLTSIWLLLDLYPTT